MRKSVLLLLVLAVTLLAGGVVAGPAAALPPCEGSLQALVDAAAPGATVEAPGGCVYRETVTIGKPLTLRAGPGGTEIRGSEIWGDAVWSQRGSTWVSSKAVPRLATDANWQCEPNTTRCQRPEQVFIDGRQLTQVAVGTTPSDGQFALDANRKVILGENPIARMVEVTERNHWVIGAPGSAGVTIDGFTMKHAASDGVDTNGNDNWTIQNGDYSYSHTSNLQFKRGVGLLALNNKIHHGGQKGVAGNAVNLTLQGNGIYENNTESFKSSWNAGGVKVSNPRTVTFDGNDVYDNRGNGLWLDVPIDNQTLVVADNRVHHNDASGIRSEVTDDNVQIHGNVVWENGWGRGGSTEAGISLNASQDNHVYDNVVAWNKNGIRVANPLRSNVHRLETEYDLVYNVEVDHNDILMDNPSTGAYALGWVKTNANGNLYDPAANNRGHDNRYWYPSPEGSENRYRWDQDLTSLSAFNDTLGEELGSYLSDAEKDELVAIKNIPASPPDTKAPLTSATPSPLPDAAGWNKDYVTVTLSAADEEGGSGVKEINYSAAGAEQIAGQTVQGNSAQLDVTTEGKTTVAFRATDNAGNVEPEKTLTVKLDKSAPSVEMATPPEGASYALNQAVNADYSCADGTGGSGVASCQGSAANGAAIDTGSTGSHAFTVTATDNVGNANLVTHTYTVVESTPPTNCSITGTANGETLTGTSRDDVICAGGGNDTIKGLEGNDILKGEGGADKLLGGTGDDTLEGGLGSDAASYSTSITAISASLATGSATGEGADTFVGVENLLGSPKSDTLAGSGENNTLSGGGGNDTVRGGAGADKVVGDGGADMLLGEDGPDALNSRDGVNANDSLDGGAGTDTKVTDASEKSITGFP